MDTLETIDPALGAMKAFAKATHGVPALVQKLRAETIYKEGTVPVKYKLLAAILWAISSRCEPCYRFYVGEAVKHGATEEELAEFLALAPTMGACVGEMWSLKAFKAYRDLQGGESHETGNLCCQPEGGQS